MQQGWSSRPHTHRPHTLPQNTVCATRQNRAELPCFGSETNPHLEGPWTTILILRSSSTWNPLRWKTVDVATFPVRFFLLGHVVSCWGPCLTRTVLRLEAGNSLRARTSKIPFFPTQEGGRNYIYTVDAFRTEGGACRPHAFRLAPTHPGRPQGWWAHASTWSNRWGRDAPAMRKRGSPRTPAAL
jgi:hypothetical protein